MFVAHHSQHLNADCSWSVVFTDQFACMSAGGCHCSSVAVSQKMLSILAQSDSTYPTSRSASVSLICGSYLRFDLCLWCFLLHFIAVFFRHWCTSNFCSFLQYVATSVVDPPSLSHFTVATATEAIMLQNEIKHYSAFTKKAQYCGECLLACCLLVCLSAGVSYEPHT